MVADGRGSGEKAGGQKAAPLGRAVIGGSTAQTCDTLYCSASDFRDAQVSRRCVSSSVFVVRFRLTRAASRLFLPPHLPRSPPEIRSILVLQLALVYETFFPIQTHIFDYLSDLRDPHPAKQRILSSMPIPTVRIFLSLILAIRGFSKYIEG